MGTRSVIYVTGLDQDGHNKALRLYRHNDGYPFFSSDDPDNRSGNLPSILRALGPGDNDPGKIAARLMLDPSARIELDLVPGLALGLNGGPGDHDAAVILSNLPDVNLKNGAPLGVLLALCWEDSLRGNFYNHFDPVNQSEVTKWAELPSDFACQSGLNVDLLGTQGDLEWVYVIDTNQRSLNVYGLDEIGSPSEHIVAGTTPMERLEGPELEGLRKLGYAINEMKLGIEHQCQDQVRRFAEYDSFRESIPTGLRLAQPEDIPGKVCDGFVSRDGEFYMLQAVPLNGRTAYVVHDKQDLARVPTPVGQQVHIEYDEKGRGSVWPEVRQVFHHKPLRSVELSL